MDDLFPILAVETSDLLCGVALILNEKDSLEMNFTQKHVHSQKLIQIIEQILKSADKEVNDLNSIAVSMGPGSFTGLRIGLAVAKGIAFGINRPIIPVPTFNAFAHQISKYLPDSAKFSIAVSASTDEYYHERFVKKNMKAVSINDLGLISKSEAAKTIPEGEMVFGNFIGNSEKFNIKGPAAVSVGEWAYLYGKDLLTFEYDYLEPNYFKKFIVKGKR